MAIAHRQTNEKVVELAEILAAGLQRLIERKSSHFSNEKQENPLDCEAVIKGHVWQDIKEMAT